MEITLHLSYFIPFVAYFVINFVATMLEVATTAEDNLWATAISNALVASIVQSIVIAFLAGIMWWIIWWMVF